MIPPMKEGRYGEGLLAGLEEVRKILTGESTLEADAKAEDEKETKDFVIKACKIWWGIGAVVVILLLLIQLMEAQTSKSDAEIKETKHNCNLAVIGGGLIFCQFPLIPIYFLLKLLLWPLLRSRVKCKQCGAVGRFKLDGSPLKHKEKNGTRRTYYYVCRNCGYEKEEETFEKESSSSTIRDRDDDRKSRSWSSGSSSSSSRGGSWGGGRSGGGGASSKF